MNPLLPYIIANNLYKKNFFLYKHLYFFYKQIKDREEIALIRQIVKTGMIVLDIGANIGFYTLLFSKLIGKAGKVYAFEPELNNFNYLKKLCRNKKNILLNNLAIGNKNGIVPLYVSNKLNVDHVTYDNKENRKIFQIKSTTVDHYLSSLGNVKVDFVKMDTQGFEYQILLGMKKTLEKNKTMKILSELCPDQLKSAGSSENDYISLLKSFGFKVRYIETNYKKRLNEMKPDKTSYVNIFASRGC